MALEYIKKALKKGRSDSLPADPNEAAYVLLPYVVQNQFRPVVELLNNSHFDVNHRFGRAQRTLLHSAANTGAIDSLLFLLKKGAIVNVQDKIGVTPLHLAARNGHKKCVQRLVECGADISIHDNEGLTALHWLACNGRIELLVSILQKGEYVDVVDVHGHTALHVACQNGHYQCVIQLLEFRADLNKPNNEGRTPLFFACRHGQLKCVKLLLMKDAEMTPDKNGESPLDVCVEGGYKECIELILMKHPDHTDRLVWLVKQETIPVDKIQSVLEYLCNCNLALMIDVVSRLANVTSTAGMELLSVSSSYQDLMPQFLRCIRVLCSLYSYYTAAQQKHNSTGSHTLPQESRPSSGSRVRRTDSLGSTLDSPRSRGSNTRTFLSSWSGHNRANSHGGSIELAELQLERENMVSASLGNLLSADFPSDPLDQLEVVWISLSSWYDLLMKEIEKIEGETSNDIEKEASSNNLHPISSESSQLAAAIILSAPPKRRQIFLHATNSTEERFGSVINDKALKRRSWHVERVAHLIALEDYSSLPTFQRSASSDLPQSYDIKSGTILEESINNTSTTPEDKPDIVGVYAERLSAVTHAFSICCNAKLKSIGKFGLHSRFLEFVDIYEPVLKVLLARSPQLIFAHFHFLLESTELLKRFIHIVHAQPFDDRKKWFYENLYKDTPPDQQLTLTPQDEIIVDRENIFTTSCSKISDASVDLLKTRLTIRFEGEAGVGAGVHREWFSNLSREILNPDYALFTQSADGATFQPNSHSDVNPDHLSYFKFAGRTMGLALYHQQLLNVYFTRSFYKHILGIPVSYKDVESIDPEYASNLQWLLDNEIDTLDLGLTFSVETDVFGATEIIELKPHGCDIPVTDQNKAEYVQLVTEMRMTQAIGPQISSFKEGFYELISHHLISLFDEYELELLLSGLPDIDVDDWEKNTEYNGYNEEMEIIKWFWEVVKEFDKKELAILLQFVTGSSRVPHGGFANLVGASGLTKFTISRLDYVPNRLPLASTCFNLLKLPEYLSKEMLKERLQFALTCGIGVIDIT